MAVLENRQGICYWLVPVKAPAIYIYKKYTSFGVLPNFSVYLCVRDRDKVHLLFDKTEIEVCSLSLGLKEIPAGVSDPAGEELCSC